MAKKVSKVIGLQIEAGKANPAPPVGPALGAAGLNIQEFCQAFNDKTREQQGPVPVKITVYEDRTFDFITKLAPMSYLIKQKLKLKKGSQEPGKLVAGKVTTTALKEVAEAKLPDLNTKDLDAALQMAIGSARSMGLDIVEQ